MDSRRDAGAAGPPSALEATGAASRSFWIDVKLGHAWFARPRHDDARAGGGDRVPALRRAELVLFGQRRMVARRITRIPADAIVALGGALSQAPAAALSGKGPAPVGANDNRAGSRSRGRSVLREVLFLAIFGATLAGTYYLGRANGFHRVIVVPEPARHAHPIV